MKLTKKKDKSAIKQYLDFHNRENKTVNIYNDNINIPNELIYIGKAIEIAYESDKFDGKKRIYVHKLKKQGNILIAPMKNGYSDLILINGIKLKIQKKGLTG